MGIYFSYDKIKLKCKKNNDNKIPSKPNPHITENTYLRGLQKPTHAFQGVSTSDFHGLYENLLTKRNVYLLIL